jgi:hypothetical protein
MWQKKADRSEAVGYTNREAQREQLRSGVWVPPGTDTKPQKACTHDWSPAQLHALKWRSHPIRDSANK